MEATNPMSSIPASYSPVPVDSEILKLRRASSKVWSDLRGAIRAIRKSKTEFLLTASTQ